MKEYWLCPNGFYDIKHVKKATLWTRFCVYMELGLRKPIGKCRVNSEEEAAKIFIDRGYWMGYYSPWRINEKDS